MKKMVRCRSEKCRKKQRELVNKIMLTVSEEFRFDYEEVKKRAKPFVQKKEWKTWVYLQKENK